jgi:hypothetical protein
MALALTWLRNTSPGSDVLRPASTITPRPRFSSAMRRKVRNWKTADASLR